MTPEHLTPSTPAAEPKPVSERRLAANRANTKKSTGPKTDTGKAKVAQNATKHGLSANHFILAHENIEEFEEFRQFYIQRFNPRDGVESHVLNQLIHSMWTLQRAWKSETVSINVQIDLMKPELDLEYENLNDDERLVFAMDELAKHPKMVLLRRYQTALENQYSRTLKIYERLRGQPLSPYGPPVAEPTPEPAPDPPAAITKQTQPDPSTGDGPKPQTRRQPRARRAKGRRTPRIPAPSIKSQRLQTHPLAETEKEQ